MLCENQTTGNDFLSVLRPAKKAWLARSRYCPWWRPFTLIALALGKKGRRRRTDWPVVHFQKCLWSLRHCPLPLGPCHKVHTPPTTHIPPTSHCCPKSTFFVHNLQATRRMSDNLSVGTSFLLHFSRILTVARDRKCQRAVGRGRCACHFCKVERSLVKVFMKMVSRELLFVG